MFIEVSQANISNSLRCFWEDGEGEPRRSVFSGGPAATVLAEVREALQAFGGCEETTWCLLAFLLLQYFP